MSNSHLIIEKSAKNTEIMLAYFLQKKVYPDKTLYIGDGYGKFPDIRTKDELLGIEVVQAEPAEDFAANMIWKKYDEFKGNARKLKTYIKTKLKHFETLLFVKGNKVEAWKIGLYGHSAYYYKHIFETSINRKLEKLNEGNYSEIDGEINLGIISIFRAKPDRIIKQIQEKYDELKMLYPLKFKKIFVLFTDALFVIDSGKITKHQISDEELELLKSDFKTLKPKK